MTDSTKRSTKVDFNGDIRRVKLSDTQPYPALLLAVAAAYQFSRETRVSLKYRDDEDEWITVGSSEELEEAHQYFTERKRWLKLKVETGKGALVPSPSPSLANSIASLSSASTTSLLNPELTTTALSTQLSGLQIDSADTDSVGSFVDVDVEDSMTEEKKENKKDTTPATATANITVITAEPTPVQSPVTVAAAPVKPVVVEAAAPAAAAVIKAPVQDAPAPAAAPVAVVEAICHGCDAGCAQCLWEDEVVLVACEGQNNEGQVAPKDSAAPAQAQQPVAVPAPAPAPAPVVQAPAPAAPAPVVPSAPALPPSRPAPEAFGRPFLVPDVKLQDDGAPDVPLAAAFIRDVNFPDNDRVVGGEVYKIWTVKNSGKSAWPAGASLVYVHGSIVPTEKNVVHAAAPGEVVDVTAHVRIPARPGLHVGSFRLSTPNGTLFGQPLWIKVIVKVPPRPAHAAPSVPPVARALPFKQMNDRPRMKKLTEEQGLAELARMGFNVREVNLHLLRKNNGDVSRVVDLLLSNQY